MADLFGPMVCVSSGHPRRWWSSLPFSIALHAGLISVAVVVPIAATGTIPMPVTMLVFSEPLVPPPPPEVPVAAQPARPIDATVPAAVPLVAPDALPTTLEPAPVPIATAINVPGSAPSLSTNGLMPPFIAVAPPTTPVRAGGQVQIPVKIVDVPPVYPAVARQIHMSGVVTLDAVIGVDGRVTEAKILRSVPLLDQAALDAVRQWRYRPTLLNGVPIAVILTVTINFTLK